MNAKRYLVMIVCLSGRISISTLRISGSKPMSNILSASSKTCKHQNQIWQSSNWNLVLQRKRDGSLTCARNHTLIPNNWRCRAWSHLQRWGHWVCLEWRPRSPLPVALLSSVSFCCRLRTRKHCTTQWPPEHFLNWHFLQLLSRMYKVLLLLNSCNDWCWTAKKENRKHFEHPNSLTDSAIGSRRNNWIGFLSLLQHTIVFFCTSTSSPPTRFAEPVLWSATTPVRLLPPAGFSVWNKICSSGANHNCTVALDLDTEQNKHPSNVVANVWKATVISIVLFLCRVVFVLLFFCFFFLKIDTYTGCLSMWMYAGSRKAKVFPVPVCKQHKNKSHWMFQTD